MACWVLGEKKTCFCVKTERQEKDILKYIQQIIVVGHESASELESQLDHNPPDSFLNSKP